MDKLAEVNIYPLRIAFDLQAKCEKPTPLGVG